MIDRVAIHTRYSMAMAPLLEGVAMEAQAMNYRFRLTAAAVIAAGCALFMVMSAAGAADNSGIIVYGQTQHASPYGSYRSERRVQVFGPASGYEYRQSQSSIVVQPYGYGYRAYPGYTRYGYGNRGHHDGRYNRFGAGVHAAPQAPFVGDHDHRRQRRHYRHYRPHSATRGSFPRHNSSGQRATTRANESARDAIRRRTIGR